MWGLFGEIFIILYEIFFVCFHLIRNLDKHISGESKRTGIILKWTECFVITKRVVSIYAIAFELNPLKRDFMVKNNGEKISI